MKKLYLLVLPLLIGISSCDPDDIDPPAEVLGDLLQVAVGSISRYNENAVVTYAAYDADTQELLGYMSLQDGEEGVIERPEGYDKAASHLVQFLSMYSSFTYVREFRNVSPAALYLGMSEGESSINPEYRQITLEDISAEAQEGYEYFLSTTTGRVHLQHPEVSSTLDFFVSGRSESAAGTEELILLQRSGADDFQYQAITHTTPNTEVLTLSHYHWQEPEAYTTYRVAHEGANYYALKEIKVGVNPGDGSEFVEYPLNYRQIISDGGLPITGLQTLQVPVLEPRFNYYRVEATYGAVTPTGIDFDFWHFHIGEAYPTAFPSFDPAMEFTKVAGAVSDNFDFRYTGTSPMDYVLHSFRGRNGTAWSTVLPATEAYEGPLDYVILDDWMEMHANLSADYGKDLTHRNTVLYDFEEAGGYQEALELSFFPDPINYPFYTVSSYAAFQLPYQ